MVINQVGETILQEKKRRWKGDIKAIQNRSVWRISYAKLDTFHTHIFSASQAAPGLHDTNKWLKLIITFSSHMILSVANLTYDLLCPFAIFMSNRIACPWLQDKYSLLH